jgi:hypothetical protein
MDYIQIIPTLIFIISKLPFEFFIIQKIHDVPPSGFTKLIAGSTSWVYNEIDLE